MRDPNPYSIAKVKIPASELLDPHAPNANTVPASPRAMRVKSSERSAASPIAGEPKQALALNAATTTEGSRSEDECSTELVNVAR